MWPQELPGNHTQCNKTNIEIQILYLECQWKPHIGIILCNACTVSLSLFADPEQILRKFYIFAEEPCKSTITTSEPCSPVFKEAQPRPSRQSISLISRIGIFMNFIIVHNVFLLLVIYCCNKASNRIVTRSNELVFYSWIPLLPEVSRLSPYTHTTPYANFKNLLHIRGTQTNVNNPFIWWRI